MVVMPKSKTAKAIIFLPSTLGVDAQKFSGQVLISKAGLSSFIQFSHLINET
jgi:hypothetical protein